MLKKSCKGGIILKLMHFELTPLIVWIALRIVNTYFKFQINIFSNDRDITKCQFLHHDDKVIAIPRVFSDNSRADMISFISLWLIWGNICLTREISAKITFAFRHSLFWRTFLLFGKYFPILISN